MTDSVARPSQLLPTDLAALPVLLAYTQQLDLRRWLEQPKRGIATLVLATCWLVLAWHGSGRPEHARLLNEPLLWSLIGRDRPPSTSTLLRALRHFSAHAVRRAVETSYLATLEGSCGRLWVSLDSHQMPYYGRLRREHFLKGWSGNHSRALRGYRLYLAVDVHTGQIVTFLLVRGGAKDARLGPVLAAHVRALLGRRLAGVVGDCGFSSHGSLAAMRRLRIPFIFGFGRSPQVKARLKALSRQQQVALRDGGAIRLGDCPWDARLCLFAVGARTPTDTRGPWVYVTSLRSYGPRQLAMLYRKRGRVEQTLDELRNGHDLDHLVGYRLAPNRVAVGFRLLARNLAIGYQLAEASNAPIMLREPLAFRLQHVHGLGIFTCERRTIHLRPIGPGTLSQRLNLTWTRRVVHIAA